MEALRFQVVGEAFKKKPLDVKTPSERPAKYFGKKVFNREKMYKYLPKDVYEKMIDVMDNGARLDRKVADAVAEGMKQWATENGVTHYTHWFQPLTEGTAEKHDSFIEHDGNGYSDEWVIEAEKRGLDVEKSCPKIFERYLDKESIEMFESLGVMTKKELEARNEVKWETYTKKIQIEARVLGDLSMNHIIPVATRYQSALLKNVDSVASAFPVDKAEKLNARNMKIIEEIAERTSAIEKGVEELVNARKLANKIEDEHEKAIAYHDKVEPYLDTIRYEIDKLELIVDDALWPLPKYRELLFIR